MSTEEPVIPLGPEDQKFVYGILREDIAEIREKAWKIFSWTSTLLLGTIGGLIAVAGKSSPPAEVLPCWPHRKLLFIAIAILTIYASLWVRQNLNSEAILLKRAKTFEIAMGIRRKDEKIYAKPWFGYRLTILLLAIAALAAIWLIPSQCSLR